MSAVAAFTRTWRVGERTVTLSLPRSATGMVHAVVEWAPSMPRHMSRTEMRAYRRGRAKALQALAAETGRAVAVVDV